MASSKELVKTLRSFVAGELPLDALNVWLVENNDNAVFATRARRDV